MALAGSVGPHCGLAVLAPSTAQMPGKSPIDWVLGVETHGVGRDGAGPPSASWLVPWLRETLRMDSASAKAQRHTAGR